MLMLKWAEKPNLDELRQAVKKIEQKKRLTWRDIDLQDVTACNFDFNGKYYRVDADEIMNIMGRTVTSFRICGGYEVPIYVPETYEITIKDIDEDILKVWLFEHFRMWEEVPE